MKPSEIVLEAANVIRKEGWWNSNMPYTNEGRCIMEAVLDCTKPYSSDKMTSIRNVIAEIVDDRPESWNDRPERKRGEVLRVLTKASRLLAKEGY